MIQWHRLSLVARQVSMHFCRTNNKDMYDMSTDFGLRPFSYSFPATWNSIPTTIINCSFLYSFKRHLKSHLIALFYMILSDVFEYRIYFSILYRTALLLVTCHCKLQQLRTQSHFHYVACWLQIQFVFYVTHINMHDHMFMLIHINMWTCININNAKCWACIDNVLFLHDYSSRYMHAVINKKLQNAAARHNHALILSFASSMPIIG